MIPFYADEWVTLYQGDALTLVTALGLQADAIVTDPPYGETDIGWDVWPAGWPSAVKAAAPSMWCFGSMRLFMEQAGEFTTAGWRLSHEVVWAKSSATGQRTDRFRRRHELVTHWFQGSWDDIYHVLPKQSGMPVTKRVANRPTQDSQWMGHRTGGQYVDDGSRFYTTVIESPNMRGKSPRAPTEKPIRVVDPLVRYVCPPGGVVLDPFAGSGATGEAARLSRRRSILIEADPAQCEVIAERMRQGFLDVPDVTPPPAPVLAHQGLWEEP